MDIKMGPIMGKTPAVVGTIEVRPGQQVYLGQILAQVETGKGNRPVKAPADGIVEQILCTEGETVTAGQTLFLFQETSVSPEKDSGPIKASLCIIGGGPGGYVAALYAAKLGLSVVLAEKELLGGTCLNCGCIPTKALIQSGRLYEQIQTAEALGISVEGVRLLPDKIFERKDAICSDLRTGVASLLESANVTVFNGPASFLDSRHVQVRLPKENRVVEFEHAIIATGSRPSIPPFFIDKEASSLVMDSRQALTAGSFPGSVAIIGAGVIGMEFAFLYRAMGATVYVLEFQPRILGNVDDDVAAAIEKEACKQSIFIYTSARVTGIQKSVSGQAVVTFEQNGQVSVAMADSVLTATGRRPYTQGLNLDAAGIQLLEQGGVQTDTWMETSAPGIYAIGDVTGKSSLAHAASWQGMTVVDVIRGNCRKNQDVVVPSVIFTSPETAIAGLTEEECQAGESPISSAVSRFPPTARPELWRKPKAL